MLAMGQSLQIGLKELKPSVTGVGVLPKNISPVMLKIIICEQLGF